MKVYLSFLESCLKLIIDFLHFSIFLIKINIDSQVTKLPPILSLPSRVQLKTLQNMVLTEFNQTNHSDMSTLDLVPKGTFDNVVDSLKRGKSGGFSPSPRIRESFKRRKCVSNEFFQPIFWPINGQGKTRTPSSVEMWGGIPPVTKRALTHCVTPLEKKSNEDKQQTFSYFFSSFVCVCV